MTLLAVARACVLAAMWRIEATAPEATGAARLVERPCLHIGLRPAAANEGMGLTVQVSLCMP